jgi:hypothetical protein
MAYYYIEFVEPKAGVSQERFDEVVKMSSERWAREHPDDDLVLNIGRTWRLGPRPSYLTVWKIKDLSTLQRWNEEFQQPVTIEKHGEFAEVATIVEAGLYTDLGDEVW